jgi:hypothetical protein
METNRPANPYLVALVVIGVCAAVLALILAAVANGQTGYFGDPELAFVAGVWAGLFGQVAILTIVGALIAAAIVWRPAVAPSPPESDE